VIRVLVVEDSLTVRKHLVEALRGDPAFDVVGEAADGKEAVDLCARLRPDVVTCDMAMPVMDGVQVVEEIMAYCPTPILIVSASLNRRDLFNTFDALAAGAVDVLDKPGEETTPEDWAARFRSTVRLVSRIKVITHLHGRLRARGVPRTAARPAAEPPRVEPEHKPCDLVAIGASTGGPGAILSILSQLPPRFAVPILVVVHIGEPFGAPFADWLDSQVPFPVACARDRQPLPRPGEASVIIAPPERHLELRGSVLHLSPEPPRHFCRPSVDVLFESVAREMGPRAVACLLTGMGRDGAAGLLEVRLAGGTTVAQDEASCVVFGMPQAAISLGAAQHVLPLAEIAPFLVAVTSSGGPPARGEES